MQYSNRDKMPPEPTRENLGSHIDAILKGVLYGLAFFVPLIVLMTHSDVLRHLLSRNAGLPVMDAFSSDFKRGLTVADELLQQKLHAFQRDPQSFSIEGLIEKAGFSGRRAAPQLLHRAPKDWYTWERSALESKLSAEFSRGKMRGARRFLDYIEGHMELAAQEMALSGIPASITLAQGILETKAGDSFLAKEANNHFGIKCPKRKGYRRDGHIDGSDFYYHKLAYDCVQFSDDHDWDRFEVYDSVEKSYRRHTILLAKSDRYNWMLETYRPGEYYDLAEEWYGVASVPYYAAWAAGLKASGYATSKTYAQKLTKIIDTYELWRLDYMLIATF